MLRMRSFTSLYPFNIIFDNSMFTSNVHAEQNHNQKGETEVQKLAIYLDVTQYD